MHFVLIFGVAVGATTVLLCDSLFIACYPGRDSVFGIVIMLRRARYSTGKQHSKNVFANYDNYANYDTCIALYARQFGGNVLLLSNCQHSVDIQVSIAGTRDPGI